MIGPVVREKASDILPVSEASFAELRATNAKIRASNAELAEANRERVVVLKAAEAKLQRLFPVGPTNSLYTLLSHHINSHHCGSSESIVSSRARTFVYIW